MRESRVRSNSRARSCVPSPMSAAPQPDATSGARKRTPPMKVAKSVAAATAIVASASPPATEPCAGGTGRIVRKAAKAAPEAAPEAAAPDATEPKPKATPKATPKAMPKAKPKAKATAKATVKAIAATPKPKAKETAKATARATVKATPKADADVTPKRVNGKQTALVVSPPSAAAAAAVADGSDDESMGVSSGEEGGPDSNADTEEVGQEPDADGTQPSASQPSARKKRKKAKNDPSAAASTDDGDIRLRDKMKSHQFNKLFNELPANVQDAYEAAKAAPHGSRQLCTRVINTAIKRSKDGAYEVVSNSPVFTDIRTKYGDKYTDAKKKGIDGV